MSERCPVESVAHIETEFLLERRLALRIFISIFLLPPLLMIPLHVDDFFGVGGYELDQSTNPTNIPRSIENPSKNSQTPFQNDSIRMSGASDNNSYLAGRDELQGTKAGLQVLCVALEVEESAGDRGLQLGGVLPGRRVGGDLVDGSHYCERRGAAGSAGGDVDGGEVRRLNRMGICCGIGAFA
jgi:hypothetical protein